METLNRLKDLGRWVLAMRRLKEKPENYGIQAARLNDPEFLSRQTERELALQTSLAGAYDTVWYPSASGQIGHDDIKTAGGEGGFSIVEEIKRTLDRRGELITPDRAATGEVIEVIRSPFGTKYVVDGGFTAPKGVPVCVRTVWIVEEGEDEPRFVTAYPREEADEGATND